VKRIVDVFLGETPVQVGVLHFNHEGARESAVFSYDGDWLASPTRFAIDPSLPLQAGPHFRKAPKDASVFHPAIADTEPDGWGQNVIRRDHAKRRNVARARGDEIPPLVNSLDFLLEVDDVSRIGALRFRDESGVFRRAQSRSGRATPPMVELRHLMSATRAVELDSETAADLAYLRGRGTSLGGLRPKCSIVDDDGHLAIGKFPSVRDTRAVTKAEVLALHLAARAGITAAKSRLVLSEDEPIAVIRRFDRTEGGRIPYVSAATLMSAEPTEALTYVDMVDTIRLYGADPQTDIIELWRRIAYSILITNVDDHLHNHGFLHVERGQWRLSPAFDVNPFPERARELKTWISQDTGPVASIDALLSVIGHFRIPDAMARAVLRQVEHAVAQWRTLGGTLGMTARELDAFTDAFEHSERAIAHGA
jgi:serine/threonine-protein kinase HipA